ncbi:MAG: hypothetical protein ACRCYY_01100 [Trueperaceae bacterium]
MSEQYKLYVFPHAQTDEQLASDIAALSGSESVYARVVLEEGGTLEPVFNLSKAQQLAHAFALLGVKVELRASAGQVAFYRPITINTHDLSPTPSVRSARPVHFVTSSKRQPFFSITLVLFIVCLALFGWSPWRSQAAPLPGVLVPGEPLQRDSKVKPWQQGDYLITPLAQYDITARVLSKKIYAWDKSADISPVDLALGWGAMSDTNLLNQLRIRQSGRWFYVYWQGGDIDAANVMQYSANTHILPANAKIAKQVRAIGQHQLVRLEGSLVQVTKADGFFWRSSLTRNDTGDGSCEILWVTHVEIVEPAPLQASR